MPAKPTRAISEADLPRYVEEFIRQRDLAAAQSQRADDMKATLKAYVEEHGLEDDKGHLWVDVDGVESVGQLKLERRSSTFLDEDAAEKELKNLDLLRSCITIVMERRLDEDKIYALAYEDRIPASVMERIFQEKVTWAFKTQR